MYVKWLYNKGRIIYSPTFGIIKTQTYKLEQISFSLEAVTQKCLQSLPDTG